MTTPRPSAPAPAGTSAGPSGPGGTPVTAGWRGVAAEQLDDVPGRVGLLLRARSRALLRQLLRPYRRQLWLAVVLVLAQNVTSLAGPLLVGVGIDRAVPALVRHDAVPLLLVVAAMAVSALLDGVLRQQFLVRVGTIGQDVLLELRRRMFAHFQRLSLAFHETYTSGRVISRLTSDLDSLHELLEAGLDGLITALLSVVTIGAILLWLDLPLAAVTLLSLPPLLWLSRWFRRESTSAYRWTREAVALVIVQLVETLGGLRAVQAFRREQRNDELFAELNTNYRRANERAWRLIALFVPAVKLLGNLTTAVVLVYGAYRVMDGAIPLGVLAAFLLYLRRFFEPLQDLSMFYNSYQSATAALEKLSGVLQEVPAVPEPVTATPLREPCGAVQLSNVSFCYRDGTVVLPGLDLTVPAGQTLALVGATGAGKSTVARLLARFYDPQHGSVRIDGVDLRELSDADLRRAVVVVTQENFLFAGTIADNIGFGRPDAPRAAIERAARAIGADEFIRALPDGYDTDVRRRGARLSAGQRQLVAFARAFLADPAVLILDEATSSLDVPSERLVQRALRTVLASRTAVIIAHRLSTVEIADRVLVLEDGRRYCSAGPGGSRSCTRHGGTHSDRPVRRPAGSLAGVPRRHPTPEPLQVNAVRVVLIGTVAWFLAFGVLVALLLVRGPAAEAGHRSWLWTSLAGWTLGLLGIFMAARARHRG